MPVLEIEINGQKIDFILDKGEFKFFSASGVIEPIVKVLSD